MEQQAIYAFLLTLMAGLSTGIGSLIALVAKRTNRKFLSFSLGFSAGVMIYISFVDLFPQSIEILGADYGARGGQIATAIAFFCGILFIALIDKLVPSVENPHEMRSIESLQVDLPAAGRHPHSKHMLRTGIMTALVIGIHNFPEGIATFMASLQDTQMGIAIAVAIAIHNIPEGIAVSVPVYYATGSRRRAFKFSFLSGLAEPIGALVGYLILAPFLTPAMLGYIFAVIAGIMVYISLDELLPAAHEYGEHHVAIWGLIVGMAVMAVGIVAFH
ncbi:zinc transporter ZupT [Millionella massiliensis]|uniref:zinc transporter ZupT n=1 Tax=Millionella massiliensis TaxID=1871023 RepID=UPI0008DAAA58|nr:zinc transporter ZupT [Millionella massiliensis]